MGLFGAWLAKARAQKKLTLEGVARLVGTEKGYISMITRGYCAPPSAKMVRKMAKVFETDVEDLLLRAWIDKAPEEIRETLLFIFGPDLDVENHGQARKK